MNKFKQVSGDDHHMSLSGRGRVSKLKGGGGGSRVPIP